MNLLERLEMASQQSRKRECSVAKGLELLSEVDRKLMVEALSRRETITSTAISREFKTSVQFSVSDQSVARHRRGICQCGQ